MALSFLWRPAQSPHPLPPFLATTALVLKMVARPLSHILRSRCLLRKPQSVHGFSTRSSLHAADHGPHYDPPSGWLFGVKPGQKYVKEGWEGVWYYGFIGSLVVAGVAYVFKPDTSYVPPSNSRSSFRSACGRTQWITFADEPWPSNADSCDRIQTWALEEARRRLEAEGILEDPEKVKK